MASATDPKALSDEASAPPSSEPFVYPDNTPMVWITQGKTDHAAYILKEHDGRKLVRWVASELTQWIDAETEIKTELPRRRKGRRESLSTDFVFPTTAVVSKPKKKAGPATKAKTAKKASNSTTKKSTGSKRRGSSNKGGKKSTAAKKRKPSARSRHKYPTGTQVFKEFPPFGWFTGEVVGMTDDDYYHIIYEDDDEENLTEAEMDEIVIDSSSTTDAISPEVAAQAPLENDSGSLERVEQTAGENTASERPTSPLRSSSVAPMEKNNEASNSESGARYSSLLEGSSSTRRGRSPSELSNGMPIAVEPQIRPRATLLPMKSQLSTQQQPLGSATDKDTTVAPLSSQIDTTELLNKRSAPAPTGEQEPSKKQRTDAEGSVDKESSMPPTMITDKVAAGTGVTSDQAMLAENTTGGSFEHSAKKQASDRNESHRKSLEPPKQNTDPTESLPKSNGADDSNAAQVEAGNEIENDEDTVTVSNDNEPGVLQAASGKDVQTTAALQPDLVDDNTPQLPSGLHEAEIAEDAAQSPDKSEVSKSAQVRPKDGIHSTEVLLPQSVLAEEGPKTLERNGVNVLATRGNSPTEADNSEPTALQFKSGDEIDATKEPPSSENQALKPKDQQAAVANQNKSSNSGAHVSADDKALEVDRVEKSVQRTSAWGERIDGSETPLATAENTAKPKSTSLASEKNVDTNDKPETKARKDDTPKTEQHPITVVEKTIQPVVALGPLSTAKKDDKTSHSEYGRKEDSSRNLLMMSEVTDEPETAVLTSQSVNTGNSNKTANVAEIGVVQSGPGTKSEGTGKHPSTQDKKKSDPEGSESNRVCSDALSSTSNKAEKPSAVPITSVGLSESNSLSAASETNKPEAAEPAHAGSMDLQSNPIAALPTPGAGEELQTSKPEKSQPNSEIHFSRVGKVNNLMGAQSLQTKSGNVGMEEARSIPRKDDKLVLAQSTHDRSGKQALSKSNEVDAPPVVRPISESGTRKPLSAAEIVCSSKAGITATVADSSDNSGRSLSTRKGHKPETAQTTNGIILGIDSKKPVASEFRADDCIGKTPSAHEREDKPKTPPASVRASELTGKPLTASKGNEPDEPKTMEPAPGANMAVVIAHERANHKASQSSLDRSEVNSTAEGTDKPKASPPAQASKSSEKRLVAARVNMEGNGAVPTSGCNRRSPVSTAEKDNNLKAARPPPASTPVRASSTPEELDKPKASSPAYCNNNNSNSTEKRPFLVPEKNDKAKPVASVPNSTEGMPVSNMAENSTNPKAMQPAHSSSTGKAVPAPEELGKPKVSSPSHIKSKMSEKSSSAAEKHDELMAVQSVPDSRERMPVAAAENKPNAENDGNAVDTRGVLDKPKIPTPAHVSVSAERHVKSEGRLTSTTEKDDKPKIVRVEKAEEPNPSSLECASKNEGKEEPLSTADGPKETQLALNSSMETADTANKPKEEKTGLGGNGGKQEKAQSTLGGDDFVSFASRADKAEEHADKPTSRGGEVDQHSEKPKEGQTTFGGDGERTKKAQTPEGDELVSLASIMDKADKHVAKPHTFGIAIRKALPIAPRAGKFKAPQSISGGSKVPRLSTNKASKPNSAKASDGSETKVSSPRAETETADRLKTAQPTSDGSADRGSSSHKRKLSGAGGTISSSERPDKKREITPRISHLVVSTKTNKIMSPGSSPKRSGSTSKRMLPTAKSNNLSTAQASCAQSTSRPKAPLSGGKPDETQRSSLTNLGKLSLGKMSMVAKPALFLQRTHQGDKHGAVHFSSGKKLESSKKETTVDSSRGDRSSATGTEVSSLALNIATMKANQDIAAESTSAEEKQPRTVLQRSDISSKAEKKQAGNSNVQDFQRSLAMEEDATDVDNEQASSKARQSDSFAMQRESSEPSLVSLSGVLPESNVQQRPQSTTEFEQCTYGKEQESMEIKEANNVCETEEGSCIKHKESSSSTGGADLDGKEFIANSVVTEANKEQLSPGESKGQKQSTKKGRPESSIMSTKPAIADTTAHKLTGSLSDEQSKDEECQGETPGAAEVDEEDSGTGRNRGSPTTVTHSVALPEKETRGSQFHSDAKLGTGPKVLFPLAGQDSSSSGDNQRGKGETNVDSQDDKVTMSSERIVTRSRSKAITEPAPNPSPQPPSSASASVSTEDEDAEGDLSQTSERPQESSVPKAAQRGNEQGEKDGNDEDEARSEVAMSIDREELLDLATALAGLPSSLPTKPAAANGDTTTSDEASRHDNDTASSLKPAALQDDAAYDSSKEDKACASGNSPGPDAPATGDISDKPAGKAQENASNEGNSPPPKKPAQEATKTPPPAPLGPGGYPLPSYGYSEGTKCPVCNEHIEPLVYSPVDWSRPLHYPQYGFAIDAIAKHVEDCHQKEPIWNIAEARLGVEEHRKAMEEHKRAVESPKSPPQNLLTPEKFCRIALRHAIGCSFAIDESLRNMAKLRDMFVRRMGIARGFVQWSSDYFLYGRTCTNCSGDIVPGFEMRRSALLLLAYLEDHVMEHAFGKNSHITEGYAMTYPLVRWRNMVQNVFLEPSGIENAWFMEEHDRPYRK